MQVADQAIDPEVGYLYFDLVCAGFDGFGYVDAIRGFPEGADWFAVDGDFGEVLHVVEIEP